MLQPDRAYRLEREIVLVNPVLPLSGLVSDEGYVITFDNRHNVGFGKVVAIYAPTGMLVRGWNLTELYAKDAIDKIPRSVSSRYWRCAPIHFVDPKDQKSAYVPEALGGSFVFTLATGSVVHTPGARKECRPPELPLSWSSFGDAQNGHDLIGTLHAIRTIGPALQMPMTRHVPNSVHIVSGSRSPRIGRC